MRRRMAMLADDVRAGQIAALLAESMRDRKAHPRPFTPADFFPSLAQLSGASSASSSSAPGVIDPDELRRNPELARRNSERMLAKVIGINQHLGGRDLRKRPPEVATVE